MKSKCEIPQITYKAGEKRKHLGATGSDDAVSDLEGDPFNSTPSTIHSQESMTPGLINRNFVALAVRVGSAKRLRAEQQRDLELFATDTLRTQNIKIFAELSNVSNRLDKIVNNAPTYQVSESLTKNIYSYALGVVFSSKLGAYKGSVPLNHVLNIIQRFRFDLPTGIEHIPADWGKVVTEVQDVLTQIRSRIKKALRASIKGSIAIEHQNIYDLTQDLIARSSCKITVQLCARVALMRAVYIEDSSDRFWNSVDDFLSRIRTKADTPEKLVRTFKHLLNEDRKKHGSAAERNLSDEYGADGFQQSVDDTIDGRPTYSSSSAMVLPSSAPGSFATSAASSPGGSTPSTANSSQSDAPVSRPAPAVSPAEVIVTDDHNGSDAQSL